jgi:hypothetical protein
MNVYVKSCLSCAWLTLDEVESLATCQKNNWKRIYFQDDNSNMNQPQHTEFRKFASICEVYKATRKERCQKAEIEIR